MKDTTNHDAEPLETNLNCLQKFPN